MNDADNTKTFLTGVRNTFDLPLAEAKMEPVGQLHKELTHEVENANEYMKGVVGSYQDDMLLAYKLEMENVYKDYKLLNDKLERVKDERRNNERLKLLKEELAWFRNESLNLNNRCEKQKELIIKMKNTLDTLTDDKQYFKQQLFKSKKIKKFLSKQLKEYEAKYPEFKVNEGLFYSEQYFNI